MKQLMVWKKHAMKAVWAVPLLLVLTAATLFARAAGLVVHTEYADSSRSYTVLWTDNNDEEGRRPVNRGAALQPGLSFTLDGNTYDLSAMSSEDQREALALIGLTSLPQAIVETDTGVNSDTVSFGSTSLPSMVYYEGEWEDGDAVTNPDTGEPYLGHAITWTVTPPQVDAYDVVSSDGGSTWTYIQETDMDVSIVLRWGTLGELNGISAAINNGLALTYVDENGTTQTIRLSDLEEQGCTVSITYIKNGQEMEGDVDPVEDDPDSARITIGGLWKYNPDGSLRTYRVVENGENPDGRLDNVTGLDGGDYFSIAYDNTQSPGHGTATDAVYDGGTVYLTLSGTTSYTATKVWLDNGSTGRPTATYYLYRYREEQPYTTAAQVWDTNGNPVTVTPRDNGDGTTYTLSYGTDGEGNATLPKYDSEGYEYIYVVREVMEGGGYEQVFGTVNDDGTITPSQLPDIADTDGGDRQAGDTFLYNEGTLSNRKSGSTTAQVVKVWNAAAFQSEFDGVTAEFTLYVRAQGSGDEWVEATDSNGAPIVRTMTGFTAETLSGTSLEISVPLYGADGQVLEYTWRETGVSQSSTARLRTSADEAEESWEYSFTLEQRDGLNIEGVTVRDIRYTSETDYAPTTGVTTITNTAQNDITYTVDKQWVNAEGNPIEDPSEALGHQPTVTFHLYRLLSGETLDEDTTPYLTLTMRDGTISAACEDSGVSAQPVSGDSWAAIIQNLPEFDENGRQYEYVLLEAQNPDEQYHVSGYETKRDEDRNYTTVATNAIGPGEHRIIVQKTWIDDTDAAHREPVTVSVRLRGTDEELATATLGEGNNGVWHALVGIGTYNVNDVYVVETSIGGHGGDSLPTWGAGTTADTFFYAGAGDPDYQSHTISATNHRYEVTYSAPQQVGAETVYNINNRRLGNVDVTVTKEWRAGDNTDLLNQLQSALEANNLRLALKLEFHPSMTSSDYTIDYANNTVQVGGPHGQQVRILDNHNNSAAAIQVITFPTDGVDDPEYYFWNLPKYDATGTIVRYTVEEVLVNVSGGTTNLTEANVVDEADYPSAVASVLSQWRRTVTEGKYTSNDSDKAHDAQAITATNSLTGSKEASWHKVWKDQYNYANGLRPDIYLDIYRVVHTGTDNPGEPTAELIIADYLWEPDANNSNIWTATITGLPQYDSWGYEIQYYAVERTAVDAASFDYQIVQYSTMSVDGTEIQLGTREKLAVLDSGTEDDSTSTGGTHAADDVGDSLRKADPMGGDPDAGAESDHPYVEAGYVLSLDGVAGAPDRYGEGYNYALGAGGTFTNTIQNDVTLVGQKLWTALPSGFAREDLPDVTFTLDRSLADDVASGGETGTGDDNASTETLEPADDPDAPADGGTNGWTDVASLTVTDWTAEGQSGSYQFTFQYLGKNVMDEDGTQWKQDSQFPNITEETPLPKYDEEGRLYTYRLEEASIDWGEGKPDEDLVYDTIGEITDGHFLVNNVYDSVKGDLAVKKLLRLPTEDGQILGYPSVTFELSRTYNGSSSQPEVVETVTWTSDEVQEAAGNGSLVWWEHVFQDYEIYAPNGETYLYTVTEVKDSLGDYDTWAAKGRLDSAKVKLDTNKKPNVAAVGDLVPDPDYTDSTGNPAREGGAGAQERGEGIDTIDPQTSWATFYNERSTTLSTVTLTGTKVWDDWDNVFEFRPGEGDPHIELKVSRSTGNPPGSSSGAISPQTLTLGTDYTVAWELDATNTNQWTFTIQGVGSDELERFAPNGLAWTYTVTESAANDPYTPTVGTVTGTWTEETGNNPIKLQSGNANLTNSLKTSASYSKSWETENGSPITENYLDDPISVTVALQVAELDSDKKTVQLPWTDASKYFTNTDNLSTDAYSKVFGTGYQFEPTLSAPINDTAYWSQNRSFTGLPRAIKDTSGNTVYLAYRVVETQIKYTYQDQEITCTVSPASDTDITGTGDITFTITTGEDESNDSLFTGASGSYTISFGSSHSALTNTMKTTTLTVHKVWQGDSHNAYGTRPDSTEADWEVSFLIQYSVDNGATWRPVQIQTGTTGEGDDLTYTYQDLVVTLRGANTEDTAFVTVDNLPVGPEYRAVELQPEYTEEWDTTEPNHTHVKGEFIINRGPNGQGEDRFHTAYGVTYSDRAPASPVIPEEPDEPGPSTPDPSDAANGAEADPTEDLSVSPQTEGGDTEEETPPAEPDTEGGYITTVTNTMETTRRSAQKIWQVPENWEGTRPSVTLHLQYLAADGETWTDLQSITLNGTADTEETPPPNRPEIYYETAPNTDGSWTAVWNGLPVYLPGSDLGEDGTDATQYRITETVPGGWLQVGETEGDDDSPFTFTNTPATSLTVKKVWSSAPADRPDIEVGLYRTTDPNAWANGTGGTEVTDNTGNRLTLSLGSNTNWTGTFSGLPKYDEAGQLYYYYALELSVGGVTVSNSGQGGSFTLDGVQYVVDYDHKNKEDGSYSTTITNSVYGQRTVRKVWRDNNAADRPTAIQVTLYAANSPYSVGATVELNAGNAWTYTWTDLPEYDDSGAKIEYTVREISMTLSDGSTVTVSDDDGDGTFTAGGYDVTINGFTITNTRYGNLSVTKTVTGRGDPEKDFHFTVTLGDLSITGLYGDLYFTAGTATFTLKNGETVTATGLPAGTTYTVTETEANQDGYSTTASGASGTIPVESTAQAAFVNHIPDPGPGPDPDPGPDPEPSTTSISGTKTWVDDSDAAGLRPDSLELTLYRSSDGGRTWTRVNATPTWSKSGNIWRYTYTDLPSGYLYRVEETVPDGYTGRQSGYHFTNTLTDEETVDIPVTKVWEDNDNAEGLRPDSITVVLYADGEAVMERTLTQAEGWTHTFTGLPRYNDDGTAIVYTVAEASVPDGYTVRYSGTTIVNTAQEREPGRLTVTKTVTGTGADESRRFTFTVTLDDRTINGTYGGMEFVNGVATFTLSHGESITADGLPAGIAYEVVEAEANQDGYDTTASGAIGTISAEGSHVSYVNHRDTPDDTPETGDSTRTLLWLTLCLASLGGAILLIVTRPRRRGKRIQ